jgi:uncharacterized protein (DUF39 family)
MKSHTDKIYCEKDSLYYYQPQRTDLLEHYFTHDWRFELNGTEMLIYEKGTQIDQAFLETDYDEKKQNPHLLVQALLTGDGINLAILFRNQVQETNEKVLAAVVSAAEQLNLPIQKLD